MLDVVFMGTPDFAVPTLMEIAGQGHAVRAVYTRAPRPAGRGMAERRSPVHEAAAMLGIPVHHPRTLKDGDAQETFREHGADVAVVVAYGLILPRAVLEAPRLGCLNVHASLLPRWRGAAPIQRAVMAGDAETGVSIMRMEEGLDTGPVLLAERLPVPPEATAGDVHDRLARLGADLMVRALGGLERGALKETPQPADGVTYAEKITKDEARIDWTRPARAVHDHARGLSPFPGAFTGFPLGDGRTERLKVLRTHLAEGEGAAGEILSTDPFVVACGEGAVRLVEVQRAGKAAGPAEAFARGARLAPGDRLG